MAKHTRYGKEVATKTIRKILEKAAIMSYNPEKLMEELSWNNPRVLYYPSGRYDIIGLFDLPFDVFIISDYFRDMGNVKPTVLHRRVEQELMNIDAELVLYKSTTSSRIFIRGEKYFIYFFQDNNKVLERIKSSGLRISCLVGICDGCREGGNYECVNTLPWLQKVLQIFDQRGGYYLLDHSDGRDDVTDPDSILLNILDNPESQIFNWKFWRIEREKLNWIQQYYNYHIFLIRDINQIQIINRKQDNFKLRKGRN